MKLTEMNTNQLVEALCRLTAPMSRIATDEELNRVFSRISNETQKKLNMSMLEKTGMLLDAVPILLGSHYDDTIQIIAIMTGKSVDEVKAQNGIDTINDLRKFIDSEFIDFFKSSAAMEQTERAKGE